jgi:chloramphenicol O-acetyltransferase type B
MSSDERPDIQVNPLINLLRHLVRASRLAVLKFRLGSKLELGNNVYIGRNALIISPEKAVIGSNVGIANNLHVETNINIGNDVLISSRVSFIGNDHRFDDSNKTVFWGGRNAPATIILEGDNLIGYGATIIGNIKIGKGCIVGASAVVTKDLPPNTICAGVPARVIRNRF